MRWGTRYKKARAYTGTAAVTINRLRSANRLSSTELKSEFRLKLILCDTLARFLWYYGGVWYINILC